MRLRELGHDAPGAPCSCWSCCSRVTLIRSTSSFLFWFGQDCRCRREVRHVPPSPPPTPPQTGRVSAMSKRQHGTGPRAGQRVGQTRRSPATPPAARRVRLHFASTWAVRTNKAGRILSKQAGHSATHRSSVVVQAVLWREVLEVCLLRQRILHNLVTQHSCGSRSGAHARCDADALMTFLSKPEQATVAAVPCTCAAGVAAFCRLPRYTLPTPALFDIRTNSLRPRQPHTCLQRPGSSHGGLCVSAAAQHERWQAKGLDKAYSLCMAL